VQSIDRSRREGALPVQEEKQRQEEQSVLSSIAGARMNAEQLSQVTTILQAAQSVDNDVRNAAERAIQQHVDINRDVFIYALIQLVRTSPVEEVRAMSAILLRQKLPNSEPVIYDKLDPKLQDFVKQTVTNTCCRNCCCTAWLPHAQYHALIVFPLLCGASFWILL
jgi:hypothetical protein